MAKRRIVLRFPPPDVESRERFLERLFSQIKTPFSRVEVRDDMVIIELAGDGASIRETVIRIKRLQEEYRVATKGKGLKVYNDRRIYREAGIAIPIDVLVEVLRGGGWRAREAEDGVETDAPFPEVISVARLVAKAIEEMKHLDAARGAKKALATVIAVTGAPLQDAVNAGIEIGVLVERGDGGLEARMPWREAAREIIRALGGAPGEGVEEG